MAITALCRCPHGHSAPPSWARPQWQSQGSPSSERVRGAPTPPHPLKPSLPAPLAPKVQPRNADPPPQSRKVGKERWWGRKEAPRVSARAADSPYPDGAVVDHEPDVSKRAGLVLGEHGTRDRAGRVQQQAAFVPRDQRAPPQVGADEPRRPVVLVERVPLVPQRHDVDGPAWAERAEGREEEGVSVQRLLPSRSAPGAGSMGRGRGGHESPRGARHARRQRQWQDGHALRT